MDQSCFYNKSIDLISHISLKISVKVWTFMIEAFVIRHLTSGRPRLINSSPLLPSGHYCGQPLTVLIEIQVCAGSSPALPFVLTNLYSACL